MKKLLKGLLIGGVVFISACALTAVQSTAQVCGIYSSTLVTLSTYKADMSAEQIAIVDGAVLLMAPVCEGDIPTGDASDLAMANLDDLELLLIQLQAQAKAKADAATQGVL